LQAAVVDPAYEVDRLLSEAKKRGWTVSAILITHTHPDHVDGAEEMAQATGAPLYVGAGEAAAAQAAAPSARVIPVADGERITVGALTLQALSTPGHTIAGTSYVVDGNVMTGDTLFVGGVGRTDFPGGDPRVLWRSLQKLAALPEETRVYPGHDYGQSPTSTIGWEKSTNPYLLCQSEDEFVALRTGKNPPRPLRRK
jgi:glyoxylase-like metal-dependent hydrolase (beta-lactamase superfamily II)